MYTIFATDIDLCVTFFMLQNLQFNMLHQNLVCSFSRDNIEFSCTNLIGIVSVCLFTLYHAPATPLLPYLCVYIASTQIEYEVFHFQTFVYGWNICGYINIDEVLVYRCPILRTYNFSQQMYIFHNIKLCAFWSDTQHGQREV